MSNTSLEAAQVLRAMSHPVRLQLLNALSDGEECVCHLTAMIGKRQAYVSQQLANLRQAGIISERKQGLRVYYRLLDPRAARILKSLRGSTLRAKPRRALKGCRCPQCKRKKG